MLTNDIGFLLVPPSITIPLPLMDRKVAETVTLFVQSGEELSEMLGISMENVAWCCAAEMVRVPWPWPDVAEMTEHCAPALAGT